MRIVIAAGLYPPEVGGPAQYAVHLTEALKEEGHEMHVVLYGFLKKLPSGLRHICYAAKLLSHAVRADAIISLDTFSVGLPAALVQFLTRKPLLIRVGGDFLWEGYVERTNDLIPLPYFYRAHNKWHMKEQCIFWWTRWALGRAIVVFNNAWLRDIWLHEYGIRAAHVIENVMEPATSSPAASKKNFLFYSRRIALKNQEAFRRAFSAAQKNFPDLSLEEGMISYAELRDRVKLGYAVVVPSISDVSPNIVLDAIRYGKPFLLTKHSGYAERFNEYGVIVDPLDERDMQRGIESLADTATYDALRERVATFSTRHTYRDIARECAALLR